ncbi:MAG: AMP-dependent synthetase/ligase [Alkalispirochaetaceae bacterium]
MARTVLAMLANAAKEFANRPYALRKVDDGWYIRTFKHIRDNAITLSCALRKEGFEAGSKGVILAEGSPEWITAEFALLYAGGISVPLSIRLLSEEVPFRVNHSESRVLFLSANTVGAVENIVEDLNTPELLFVILDNDEGVKKRMTEATKAYDGYRCKTFSELMEAGRRCSEAELQEVAQQEERAEEDEVVTISYTSGTTGNPKGIMLTNVNYYVNCQDSINMFEVPYDFSTLLILPCDHSFAHTVGLYAALVRGISLYFVDARGGPMAMLRHIPQNLQEANPKFLLTVPALTGNFMKKMRRGVEEKGKLIHAIFEKGLEAGIRRFGDGYSKPSLFVRLTTLPSYLLAEKLIFKKLRRIFGKNILFCVGGGALLEKRQQEFFNAIGVPIYQGYGLTEAAPVISSNTPKLHRFGSSGMVAPSVTCRILREDGSEAATGEKGEIVIRGENVMKGYYRNEEATREAVIDGWLHTGDLGYYDEDGFLFVVGRKKALLISADGEKYSPEEIEEALANSSAFVEQVMLYNDHRRYTTCLIVPNQEAVGRFLKERSGATPKDVLDLFASILEEFSEAPENKHRFPMQWIPATFQLLTEPFTMENRMVNSSAKMVRHKVVEAYEELLDYMYSDEGSEYENPKNREAVRSLFFV